MLESVAKPGNQGSVLVEPIILEFCKRQVRLASKRKYKSNHVVRPMVRGCILNLGVSEVKVDRQF